MNGISRSMQKIIQLIPNRHGQYNIEYIEKGSEVLMKGGIIALPTDTLYGLAARVGDSDALEKIYSIKGRDLSKPLAIAINSLSELTQVAKVSELQMKAAQLLLPGQVTLLLDRSDSLNPRLNPGVNIIGVRIPSHNYISGITHMVGPIALTSANKSGETNPVRIEDFEDLWPQIDLIIDHGPLQKPILEFDIRHDMLGSTVVDLTTIDQKYYRISREGLATNRTMSILLRLGLRRKY